MNKTNCSSLFRVLLLGFLAIDITACATQPMPQEIAIQPDQGPVLLALKPSMGDSDITQYRSRTVTTNFIEGQIRHKLSESLDFKVETKVLHVDTAHNIGTYQLSTLEKDGKADMNDYALPEPEEPMEIVLNANAKVLRAGNYPPGTLFYVPPISLPEKEVSVGDTWPMSSDWVSLKSGINLRLEIVSTLKSIRDCGAPGRCAEVEVSGGVVVPGANALNISSSTQPDVAGVKFSSEIRGRMLLSLSKGTVLYSIVRTDEKMSSTKESSEVASCMVSYTIEPSTEKVKISSDGSDCQPNAELPLF